MSSEKLNRLPHRIFTNSRGFLGGRKNFYPLCMLSSNLLATIWSLSINSHDWVRVSKHLFIGGHAHCLTFCRSSDYLWDLPRSTIQGKVDIWAQRPIRTCSNLCFHSSSDTWPPEDLHGILPTFYRLHCLSFHSNTHYWYPPRGSHSMVILFRLVGRGAPSPKLSKGNFWPPTTSEMVDLR